MITMSVGYRKNPCIQVQDRLDTMAVVPQRVGLPASHVLDSHQSQGLPVGMALAEFQLKSLLFATPSIFCNTRFLCNLFPCNTFQACSTFRFFTPLGLGCNALFYFFCILRFQYLEAHVFCFFQHLSVATTPFVVQHNTFIPLEHLATFSPIWNTLACLRHLLYLQYPPLVATPFTLQHPSLFATPLLCNAFSFTTPFPLKHTPLFATPSLICSTLPYLPICNTFPLQRATAARST